MGRHLSEFIPEIDNVVEFWCTSPDGRGDSEGGAHSVTAEGRHQEETRLILSFALGSWGDVMQPVFGLLVRDQSGMSDAQANRESLAHSSFTSRAGS